MSHEILEICGARSTSNVEAFSFDEFRNMGRVRSALAKALFSSCEYKTVPGVHSDNFKSELKKSPPGAAWYEKDPMGFCRLIAVNI